MKKIKFVTLIFISLFIISCDNSQNENEKTLPEDELGILEKNELSVIDKAFKNEIALIKSDSNKSIDIIEFSSFTCSHCADFHNSTLKEILSSEVGGKINYYIIDFFSGRWQIFKNTSVDDWQANNSETTMFQKYG